MINNRLEIIVEIPNSIISTPTNPNGVTRYNLDTFPPEEQEPIELNFCINDINDISNRNSSSSKTITLPESKNNREVFGFISDLNLQINTFSPNKRSKCYVMLDTIVVLEGWLQLKNIKPNYRTGLTKLECVVYSNQVDFFKSIGEKYLQDLTGFTHMTYSYTPFGITSSWFESQNDTDIYYPLIDYGVSIDNKLKESSTSFNVKSIGADGGTQSVNYNQLFPAVYVKSIVDAIFRSAKSDSYTDPSTGLSASTTYLYDSNFFNSNWFKNLIIPYTNPKFYKIINNKPFLLNSTYFEGVNGNRNGIFTCTSDSRFTFTWDNTPNDNFLINVGELKYINSKPNLNFILNTSLNFTHINTTGHLHPFAFTILIFINTPSNIVSSTTYNYSGEAGNFNLTDTSVLYHAINFGDKMYVTLVAEGNSNGEYENRFTAISFISNITDNTSIVLGDTFDMRDILPQNIKQKDLLNTIFKMFNLYIDYDTNNTNILRIEPRDDYYYFTGTQSTFYGNSGWNKNNLQKKDWSSKVDINQEINIQLLAETQNKTIKLSYKEDKDYFNDSYQGAINRIYGDKIIEIDNDFNFGEQVISVLFGPTVLVNIPGMTDFPIPNLTKQIDSVNNLPNGRSNCAPKIMQRYFDFNYIKNTNNIPGQPLNLNYKGNGTSYDYWKLGIGGTNSTTYGYYPYAGNFDNPFTPNIDLDFDQGLISFYSMANNPTYTLYNTFYKNQFDEILDINSKILTAQLYLTPQDIRDFRFSDVIFLRLGSSGQYYHVNKINNYSLTEPQKTVEVELIKIKEICSYPLN